MGTTFYLLMQAVYLYNQLFNALFALAYHLSPLFAVSFVSLLGMAKLCSLLELIKRIKNAANGFIAKP